MHEATKECIRQSLKCYEYELSQVKTYINHATERLTSLAEEKNELLEKIKVLKEDLGEETTEI